MATYDGSGPSTSGIAALRAWQGHVADVVEDRRPSGNAEARYRKAVPEDLRHGSKPGRGASPTIVDPDPIGWTDSGDVGPSRP